MDRVNQNSIADMVFQLKWKSQKANHTESYAGREVNLWRDWLPEKVSKKVLGKRPWERLQVSFAPGELFGTYGERIKIDRRRFSLVPHVGRFYPKGRLSGIPGVFPQNMQPFRCLGIENGDMEVDLAHPLVPYPLSLSVTVGEVSTKATERGGSSVDWLDRLTSGPGMQARKGDSPTDFFSGNPFDRRDKRNDGQFYGGPRLVHHLDQTAREMVANIYKRFVKDGMQVMDLMSSWVSHIPADIHPEQVFGLGMNRTEMEQNPALKDVKVHDLNADPELPYNKESFDVVICTVSVEYLIHPLTVFKEVARVLKPGGIFAVTFSNRWFSPKVIRIWEEIHEFERIGLVMEYFLDSGLYEDLGTYSMRGLPRPQDDKYAREQPLSDPVYAVWGSRNSIMK